MNKKAINVCMKKLLNRPWYLSNPNNSWQHFHRFQYAEEAVSVGFDNVIKTKMPLLVMSGVGVSLSTTVSILTISCMALLRWLHWLHYIQLTTHISWIISIRWSITSTRNDIMDFFESHCSKIITFLWTIGRAWLKSKSHQSFLFRIWYITSLFDQFWD